MKFLIKRDLLDMTLQNVSKGLSTKTPMPVLTGIQITANSKELIFVTTNKEISIKIVLPIDENVQVLEEGVCVVPGKYFVDIVKKIEGNVIDFTVFDETTIKIICDKTDFTLIALDKTNYPVVNFDLNDKPIMIPCKELKKIIKQTTFACSNSENRVILTSVNFALNGNKLNVLATDSFRLSLKTVNIPDNDQSFIMNIPSKSLEELSKILIDSDQAVSIYVSNNKVIFKNNNLLFATRLVEGKYPASTNFFPKQYLFTLKLNRADVISAVDRASLFTDLENLSHVKLTVSSSKDTIEIASTSTEIGRVVESLKPIEISEKLDFQVAFSAKFLLDALKAFDSDNVVLCFTGEIKPAIIKSDKNDDLIQLLLPMRVF